MKKKNKTKNGGTHFPAYGGHVRPVAQGVRRGHTEVEADLNGNLTGVTSHKGRVKTRVAPAHRGVRMRQSWRMDFCARCDFIP